MKKQIFNHEEFTKTVEFVDADGNKAEIEINLTHRNGYDEFTMSGNYSNGGGQVQDHIKPANEPQQELLNLWEKWHLNGTANPLPEDITERVDTIIEAIEEAEQERKGDQYLKDMNESEALELIEDETGMKDRDAELCLMLAIMENLTVNEIDEIEIDGNRCTVQGTEYLAGNDSEMDEEWDADLENYIDDCVIGCMEKGVRETVGRYFDREAWKEDAKQDGRAHSLNRYNGGEEERTINGTAYFAYRQ